ncbi:MAG TPA: RNA ligase family protein, partial [Ignavibacteriaceae bacterium]
MHEFIKFDRTPHLEGSRLQEGDEDLSQIPFKKMKGRWIVVEEKFDGGNSGISFPFAELKTQSRGHYLEGGDHSHFNMFKKWAACHQDIMFDRLGDQYIMFGEWMLAKHSVFYNQLPHYFLEFDIWDRSQEGWLDTPSRKIILGDAPVLPVKVLYEGECPGSLEELLEDIRPSVAKNPNWIHDLQHSAERAYKGRKDYNWE